MSLSRLLSIAGLCGCLVVFGAASVIAVSESPEKKAELTQKCKDEWDLSKAAKMCSSPTVEGILGVPGQCSISTQCTRSIDAYTVETLSTSITEDVDSIKNLVVNCFGWLAVYDSGDWRTQCHSG